jgi:hypothetical protein
LVITYTNETATIEKWLTTHVLGKNLKCIGLDTESKPCFTTAASKAARGPDTLQLAVAYGPCLVVHLSRMEKSRGFGSLLNVLKNNNIAKAGVGIDDDALELHKNHLLGMSCRLDLRAIAEQEQEDENDKVTECSGSGGNQQSLQQKQPPQGLKALSEKYVKGLILPKKKRLQMSNWAAGLANDQIVYAAADAFAGAAAVAALTDASDNEHTEQSLIEMALKDELGINLLEKDRAEKKQARKRQKDKERKAKSKQSAPRKKFNGGKHTKGQTRRGQAMSEYNSKEKAQSNQKGSPYPSNKKRKLHHWKEREEKVVATVYKQLN